jgi:outer membrane protein insertion porin family
VGLRIAVPQLGPVPLAFDFAIPLIKEDQDRERVFSFTLDVPF